MEQSDPKLYSTKGAGTSIAGHYQILLATNSEAHTVTDMYSMAGKRETITITLYEEVSDIVGASLGSTPQWTDRG